MYKQFIVLFLLSFAYGHPQLQENVKKDKNINSSTQSGSFIDWFAAAQKNLIDALADTFDPSQNYTESIAPTTTTSSIISVYKSTDKAIPDTLTDKDDTDTSTDKHDTDTDTLTHKHDTDTLTDKDDTDTDTLTDKVTYDTLTDKINPASTTGPFNEVSTSTSTGTPLAISTGSSTKKPTDITTGTLNTYIPNYTSSSFKTDDKVDIKSTRKTDSSTESPKANSQTKSPNSTFDVSGSDASDLFTILSQSQTLNTWVSSSADGGLVSLVEPTETQLPIVSPNVTISSLSDSRDSSLTPSPTPSIYSSEFESPTISFNETIIVQPDIEILSSSLTEVIPTSESSSPVTPSETSIEQLFSSETRSSTSSPFTNAQPSTFSPEPSTQTPSTTQITLTPSPNSTTRSTSSTTPSPNSTTPSPNPIPSPDPIPPSETSIPVSQLTVNLVSSTRSANEPPSILVPNTSVTSIEPDDTSMRIPNSRVTDSPTFTPLSTFDTYSPVTSPTDSNNPASDSGVVIISVPDVTTSNSNNPNPELSTQIDTPVSSVDGFTSGYIPSNSESLDTAYSPIPIPDTPTSLLLTITTSDLELPIKPTSQTLNVSNAQFSVTPSETTVSEVLPTTSEILSVVPTNSGLFSSETGTSSPEIGSQIETEDTQTPATTSVIAPESISINQPLTTSTKDWLPSRIIQETATTEDGIFQATDLPSQTSGLPRAITPPTQPTPVANYDLITIGFKSELNYKFVVDHSLSSAQIFQYLPLVLKFPFGDSNDYNDVSVKRLVPYSAEGIPYTITVAEVYFPHGSVEALAQYIQTPGSLIYRNGDSTQKTLASLIDSRIPLTGLNNNDNDGSSGSNTASSRNGSLDAYSQTSVKNSGRIAAITIGSAAGCGVYMTLVFLLFKKLRNKKNGLQLPDSESNLGLEEHNESSSFSSLFQRINREGPVTGDRSNIHISTPVNASNSLGWTH